MAIFLVGKMSGRYFVRRQNVQASEMTAGNQSNVDERGSFGAGSVTDAFINVVPPPSSPRLPRGL